MKKVIAAVLTICLFSALSVNLFAITVDQDNTNSKDEQVTVRTSIAPTYIVTIPEDATVTYNNNKATSTNFGTISATNVRLHPNKKVVVSVVGDLTMKNADDETKTIPYAITSGGETFTSVDLLATGDEAELKIEITAQAWAAAYAGSYSDTVTFTVAYIDKAE